MRNARILALVIALSLVSAACSGPAPQSGAPAASAGPIKIGLLEDLTGPLAPISKDNVDGWDLYLDSINHTVAGRQIEVTTADDQSQADVGLSKARQLVENDNVVLLAGIQSSSVGYALAPYVKQAKVPLVITGNSGGQGMTTDPKFSSPYLMRLTQSTDMLTDTLADYLYAAGKRRLDMLGLDYVAGIENMGGFEYEFVQKGGTIVQEVYPALGTNDFGPFLAQIDTSADGLVVFIPGADSLRFVDQYAVYGAEKKPQIYDMFGAMTDGSVLAQEGANAVGIIANNSWTLGYDGPENARFKQAWTAKYPGRLLSAGAAVGYEGAQGIVSALQAINGKVEDQSALLSALYNINLETPKGPIKLDDHHDVVENIYIYQIAKEGDSFVHKAIKTYPGVSGTWDRTASDAAGFPWGKTKGSFVNVSKDALPGIMKGLGAG